MPGCWVREDGDWEWREPPPPVLSEVYVSENPVVAELLGPDGAPIRQWAERSPIGYRLRSA